jgi:hypothetical protein
MCGSDVEVPDGRGCGNVHGNRSIVTVAISIAARLNDSVIFVKICIIIFFDNNF